MKGISENCYNYNPQQNSQWGYAINYQYQQYQQYQQHQQCNQYQQFAYRQTPKQMCGQQPEQCKQQTDTGDNTDKQLAYSAVSAVSAVSTRLTNIMSFPSNNVLTDKYIAIKQIGTGTFGDIWKVMEKYDISRQRQCEYAIKIIKPNKKWKNEQQKQKYVTMFLSEGKRIMNLNKLVTNEIGSNFIIQCREILSNENNSAIGPCIVMELCSYSLLKYIRVHEMSSATISLDTIRYICIQILSAMSFINGCGNCIHSDLKPENILIKTSGNSHNKYPHIKIIDFGNAITMNKKIKSFQIQTLWYRAPELLFGNTFELSSAIDMWSVGCILFELFSYHRLFKCNHLNKIDVIHNIHKNLSPNGFPVYIYNKYKSYHFADIVNHFADISSNESNYQKLKTNRKYTLLHNKIGIHGVNYKNFNEQESMHFIDLLASILDLNPFTRYSSEDAIRHKFIINNYNNSKYKNKKHPIIKYSNDIQRQNRINKSIMDYLLSMKNDKNEKNQTNNGQIPETTIKPFLY